MSTRSGALPIERTFIRRAWLAFTIIVVALAVMLALVISRPPASGTIEPKGPAVTNQLSHASFAQSRGPTTFNDGTVCGQCR